MWNDIETTQDFLNFSVFADTVAELIIEANGQPISIGVSGNWGVGKSSMVKMIGESLRVKCPNLPDEDNNYIFLEFNAWLYQGYDDARTALLHSVTKKLLDELKKREAKGGLLDKLRKFSRRVNWLQIAKLTLPLSIGLLPGGAAVGGIASLLGSLKELLGNPDSERDGENSENLNEAIESLSPEIKNIIKESTSTNIPQQIEELRTEFEDLLSDMKVNLVVLVDDLDRCLPSTAISTLEAMRLLLFVKRTAFIIAADEQMIRSSVKAHFSDVEMNEGLVTSYFDKLIQIPLSVPRLGIAEVKIYMVSLFFDLMSRRHEISDAEVSSSYCKLQLLLRDAWSEVITKDMIKNAFTQSGLVLMENYIEITEQLAGILVTAEGINGNPRLIKRFLNAIIIRNKIADLSGITVDFGHLVKMMLFERCASSVCFDALARSVIESDDGKSKIIAQIENSLAEGKALDELDTLWKSDFLTKWFQLEPLLGNVDLRPLLYLSRNKSLSLAAYDMLSNRAQ